MAEIFLARDLELDMDIALKVVPSALADDSRLIKHLREEARIAIQLAHQNIVRVYSFDASGDIKFIVMEYVPGKNLYQMIHETPEGRFPAGQVVEWLGPACDALEYAHSLGVIHRDVKPSNIMVRQDGVVKVADFGIARRIEESMQAVSQHTVRGTPSYMSPEQLRGESVTVVSDTYSLAATVYMLLSGEPPFPSAVAAASSDRPPPKLITGIPPRLFRAIVRSLDFDPHKRAQSVREFYDAMADALKTPVSARLVREPAVAAHEEPAAPPADPNLEETAIPVDAEELPDSLDPVALALRDKAGKALEDGDMVKARKLSEELTAIVPQNSQAWTLMGDCCLKMGDAREAVDAYQNALKVNRDNLYARFQLGLSLEQLGDTDGALKIYRETIRIRQETPLKYPEITLQKLKNQARGIEWKEEQAAEERRRYAREMHERQEQEQRRAQIRRRRAMQAVILIIVVMLLLCVILAIGQSLFNLF
jgi:serine/threonine-protein kinase